MLTPFKSPQLTTAGAQDSVYESDKSVQLPDKTSVPQLFYYPVACDSDIYPGQLTTKTSQYVLNTLEAAVLLCKSGAARAIVTGPVHKGIINDAGIAFSGHTDWLKERTGADHVVMLLANDHLRVALTTTHIPLSDVSNALTAARLERTIRILHREMQQLYQLAQPRIAVCGLNPHAGEGGHLGTEEQTVIEPCLEKLRSEGFKLIGPLPADTAFLPHLRAQYDVCLTHYHDQGLPVLKALDFEGAINVSLGLPIIRTSVDHGTALALAGSGKASAESFKQAVKSAIFFAQSRQQQQPPAHNASTSATQDPKDL
jgi:4-hydroxythreonine-4-phosphate dehydrogenase